MRKTVMVAMATGLLAASPALAIPKDFKTRADALIAAAYPADGPGAVAVVFERGKPVYAVGRGLADVGAKTPLTPTTPMRLGSITKQFTAALILQLVQEGKVGLDDPLAKYLPDYPKPAGNVTVRQLLNHTAGIANYTAIPGFMMKHSAEHHSTGQLVASFRDLPLDFPAGSQWAYSNSGYVLLGAIVEKVTGQSWGDAVHARIAKPLGLVSLRDGSRPDGETGMAHGYRLEEDKVVPARPIDMTVPYAAGALVSDALDLAKWAEALHHGKVVDPARYALMTTPTTLPGGKIEKYGFGLTPGEVRGHPSIGHDGGIFGFSTDSLYLTKEGIFVAVLSNTERPPVDPEMMTRKLAALAVGDAYESFTARPLDAKVLAPVVGIYRAGDVERAVYLRDGKLFTRRKGGGPLEAKAAGGNRYFYEGSLSWFALGKSPDGKPTVTFHADGARDGEVMAWAGPMPADAPVVTLPKSVLDRLAGTYDGPVPVVVAIDSEGQLTLKFGPQPVTHLLAESASLFRVKEIEAKVSFQESGGKVTGLTIHQNGKDLPIKRAD